MNATPAGPAALAVAERLLRPEAVLAAVPGREGAPLAHGLAGTALRHARLATVDPVFRAAADSHWAAAASHARRYRAAGAGAFTSGGGLAASLIIGTGYLPDPAARQASAGRAAAWLARQAQRIAGDIDERRRAGDPCTPRAAYDVINGLAGIGRVLLAAVTAGLPAAEPGLLAALETLTTMIETPLGTRPGWVAARLHAPARREGRPLRIGRHRHGARNQRTVGLPRGGTGRPADGSRAGRRTWFLQGGRDAVVKDLDGGAGRCEAAEDLVVELPVNLCQAGLMDRDGDLGGDGAEVVDALA